MCIFLDPHFNNDYFVFRFDNEEDADSLNTNLGTMLQEENIEESTYCVMKSPSKKDCEKSN
jgi:hypothetical protein